MTCRVEKYYHLIWICNIYILLETVICENGNVSIFSFWWYPWCVSAGRLALISDNKMADEPKMESQNPTRAEETVDLVS